MSRGCCCSPVGLTSLSSAWLWVSMPRGELRSTQVTWAPLPQLLSREVCTSVLNQIQEKFCFRKQNTSSPSFPRNTGSGKSHWKVQTRARFSKTKKLGLGLWPPKMKLKQTKVTLFYLLPTSLGRVHRQSPEIPKPNIGIFWQRVVNSFGGGNK